MCFLAFLLTWWLNRTVVQIQSLAYLRYAEQHGWFKTYPHVFGETDVWGPNLAKCQKTVFGWAIKISFGRPVWAGTRARSLQWEMPKYECEKWSVTLWTRVKVNKDFVKTWFGDWVGLWFGTFQLGWFLTVLLLEKVLGVSKFRLKGMALQCEVRVLYC